MQRCGAGDVGLAATARALAARRAAGEPLAGMEGIAFAQRAAGEPHPWARAWAATGASLDEGTVGNGVAAWLQGAAGADLRRCGAGSARSPAGTRTLVVVAVEALADLTPLPTRVRLGQWVEIEARFRVRASGGRVLLAGATGVPREVPAWFDGTTLRARFAPPGPGALTVQVVADLPTGPRPVLEAAVFADEEPPAALDPAAKAPGEDAPPCDGACLLASMLSRARASEGLAPLARDRDLDAIARAHAAQMARLHELAHDAGDGSPVERVRAAGLDAPEVAEDLARAASIALAHRALWTSPSHRAVMLLPRMRHVGVGVVADEHGELWAVEIETL